MTRSFPIRRTRRPHRSGYTLIELMVVTVLLAIVAGALMSLLARQQRFYRGTGDLMDLRSQLRQASEAITADLRGVSSGGGDILAMTDSSIDFRQTIGESVICSIPTKGGTTIMLPPKALASGAVLTDWLTRPIAGRDSVFVFTEGPTTAMNDDRWDSFGIASDTAVANACPSGTGTFTSSADASRNSYTVTLGGNLDTTVAVGAPVRFYHVAHYSLYQAADRNWYLGYCSPACGGGNPITAIAGPFLPYSTSSATSGLVLTYYDSSGTTTADPTKVARIRMVIHGKTRNPVNLSGFNTASIYDSLVTTVAVRNRS